MGIDLAVEVRDRHYQQELSVVRWNLKEGNSNSRLVQ